MGNKLDLGTSFGDPNLVIPIADSFVHLDFYLYIIESWFLFTIKAGNQCDIIGWDLDQLPSKLDHIS